MDDDEGRDTISLDPQRKVKCEPAAAHLYRFSVEWHMQLMQWLSEK